MVAALTLPPETRQRITCPKCGGYVGHVGRRLDIPPGTIWITAKCPGSKCGRWVSIDVATGDTSGPSNEKES
jgi:hypothetical protein